MKVPLIVGKLVLVHDICEEEWNELSLLTFSSLKKKFTKY